MALREALVGLVGIERARGDEFDTRDRTGDEVLLRADSAHLDFRCVVRCEARRVVLATAVDLHGFRGRLVLGRGPPRASVGGARDARPRGAQGPGPS